MLDLVLRTLRGEIRPVMSLYDCRQIGSYPTTLPLMRGFVDRMKAMEGKDGVLSISIGHCFPYADVAELGGRILVVVDKDKAKADALATARSSLGGAHPRDFALLALSARSEIWRQLARSVETDFLDPLEAVGAGGYIIVGLAALASGTAFLTNLFGLGTTGTLVSSGSIALLNWASAIAVSCAMVLLFAEFLETYVVPLEPEDAAS